MAFNPYDQHLWYLIVDQNFRIGLVNWMRAHIEELGWYAPGPQDEENIVVPCSESGAGPIERYAHSSWITELQFDELQTLMTDLPPGIANATEQLLLTVPPASSFTDWLASLVPPMLVINEEEPEPAAMVYLSIDRGPLANQMGAYLESASGSNLSPRTPLVPISGQPNVQWFGLWAQVLHDNGIAILEALQGPNVPPELEDKFDFRIDFLPVAESYADWLASLDPPRKMLTL